jgi:hypothetical protein
MPGRCRLERGRAGACMQGPSATGGQPGGATSPVGGLAADGRAPGRTRARHLGRPCSAQPPPAPARAPLPAALLKCFNFPESSAAKHLPQDTAANCGRMRPAPQGAVIETVSPGGRKPLPLLLIRCNGRTGERASTAATHPGTSRSPRWSAWSARAGPRRKPSGRKPRPPVRPHRRHRHRTHQATAASRAYPAHPQRDRPSPRHRNRPGTTRLPPAERSTWRCRQTL